MSLSLQVSPRRLCGRRNGVPRGFLLDEAARAGRRPGVRPRPRRRPSSASSRPPGPPLRRRAVAEDVLPASVDEINRRGYLKDAYFEFDKYAIEAAQRDALAGDAKWLKAHPTVRATIEGHCDERGRPNTTWPSGNVARPPRGSTS